MKNKPIRKQLELLYQAKCFVTGRIDKRQLHHIIKKCLGGPTTIENGVVLNDEFHRYLHSLEITSPETFDLINECLMLAKIATDKQEEHLLDEWSELKLRLTKESKRR